MAKIGSCLTGVASTARKDDLADVDTGDKAVGLAEGTTHTSLKSIGTGARQHLVDTDDVEGVDTDTHVERVLARGLGHVFVGANTSSFQGLARQLFVFIGDEMAAEREIVHRGTFAAQVKNTNLWQKEDR